MKKARESKEVMGNYYNKAFKQEEGQVGPILNIQGGKPADKVQEQFLNNAEQQLRHYNTMNASAEPSANHRSRSAGERGDVEMHE